MSGAMIYIFVMLFWARFQRWCLCDTFLNKMLLILESSFPTVYPFEHSSSVCFVKRQINEVAHVFVRERLVFSFVPLSKCSWCVFVTSLMKFSWCVFIIPNYIASSIFLMCIRYIINKILLFSIISNWGKDKTLKHNCLLTIGASRMLLWICENWHCHISRIDIEFKKVSLIQLFILTMKLSWQKKYFTLSR